MVLNFTRLECQARSSTDCLTGIEQRIELGQGIESILTRGKDTEKILSHLPHSRVYIEAKASIIPSTTSASTGPF